MKSFMAKYVACLSHLSHALFQLSMLDLQGRLTQYSQEFIILLVKQQMILCAAKVSSLMMYKKMEASRQ